jgi:hypothetical protein
MVMILRKFSVCAYENDSPDILRYSDTVVAFSEEEAIRFIASKSKFNGESQGHPNHNWNPKYPVQLRAKEIID